MSEAYIRLLCPNCSKDWEKNPSDLASPQSDFSCPHCSTDRSLSEFMRTTRDLEILEEFHESPE